jgi:hypothetical protein
MKNSKYLSRLYACMITIVPMALLLVLSGCEIQKDFDYKSSGSNGVLDVNAWEFIQETDSLSLMEEAVIHAGMENYYTSTTERTFIVPRNSAFRTYLKSNSYTSIDEIPVSVLQGVLEYHLVNARVIFSDPELILSDNPIAYDTESGEIMYLSHNSNFQGLINEGTKKSWTIITSNIEPTNGVIHVTSNVVYLSL